MRPGGCGGAKRHQRARGRGPSPASHCICQTAPMARSPGGCSCIAHSPCPPLCRGGTFACASIFPPLKRGGWGGGQGRTNPPWLSPSKQGEVVRAGRTRLGCPPLRCGGGQGITSHSGCPLSNGMVRGFFSGGSCAYATQAETALRT